MARHQQQRSEWLLQHGVHLWLYLFPHTGYFTNALITDPYDYDRNETVGGTQTSQVAAVAANTTALVVKPMIAGLELYNILGLNQQVRISS